MKNSKLINARYIYDVYIDVYIESWSAPNQSNKAEPKPMSYKKLPARPQYSNSISQFKVKISLVL